MTQNNLITFQVPINGSTDAFQVTWSKQFANENFECYKENIASIKSLWEKLTPQEKCILVYMKKEGFQSFETLKTIINRRLTENDENMNVNASNNQDLLKVLIEAIGNNRINEIVDKLTQDNVYCVSDNDSE